MVDLRFGSSSFHFRFAFFFFCFVLSPNSLTRAEEDLGRKKDNTTHDIFVGSMCERHLLNENWLGRENFSMCFSFSSIQRFETSDR